MQAPEAVEADSPVEVAQRLVERDGVDDVDTRRVPVARIDAHAERRVTVQRFEERFELGGRAAHGPARTGGVLEQQPCPVGAAVEQLAQHGQRPLHAGVEAGPEV